MAEPDQRKRWRSGNVANSEGEECEVQAQASPPQRHEPDEEPTATIREITWSELAKHSKKDDCWIAIDNVVYDVSTFLEHHHPGGDQAILELGGRDATRSFGEARA
jgi:cytochrome b involved in lipid metabolism